jgi:hypothetical protein
MRLSTENGRRLMDPSVMRCWLLALMGGMCVRTVPAAAAATVLAW